MKAASDKQNSRGGFSFIEVLVASAIFILSAAMLTDVIATALILRDRPSSPGLFEEDLKIVRQQLLLETNYQDAISGGDVETIGGGRASWEAAIEPTEMVNLFEVTFSIRFSDPDQAYPTTHTERLFLLRPTWSDAADRSILLEDKRQLMEQRRSFSGGFNR